MEGENGQLRITLTPVAGTLWTEDPQTDGARDYLIADVFTDTPLEGNQLGVFLDARGMTADLMQRTARELNISETVFFLPADNSKSDVRVRIFTPGRELPFAGHPCLGAGFVLAERLGKKNITLQTGVGPIPLTFQDDGYGEMEQLIPQAEPYENTRDVLDALHLEGSQLPVEAYRNGPRYVYIALPDKETVADLKPDIGKLTEHEVGVNCFAGHGTSWKTRMFAPSLAVNEDPATGSAAGPLGVHLARHGRIEYGQRIEVSQGKEIGRPSTLYVQIDGRNDIIEHVYVGGYTVIVAHGQYRLR
jgi:trans-2,3-dihydro-3-hydroxyanthranilate isomerase